MFDEAQQLAITRTELDDVFFQRFEYDATTPEQATARTPQIFKPIETDSSAYIEEVYMGSPLFSAIGEIDSVPNSVPHVANKYFAYVQDFAQSIRISKDLFDDNKHGVWAETVKDFAMVARVTQDQTAFGIFRGAFTTTLTADGVALCGTHNLINGSTYSNTLGTGVGFSDTAVYQAIVAMRQQVNQRNIILGNVPETLLVPSVLFKHALQITDSALVADSANNNINVYRSAYNFDVRTSVWLDAAAGGSDTAWFLLAANHRIRRLIRQGIETALVGWQYSENRTYLYQANYRETYYALDYIGVVGVQS